jgi:hypothetical protein
VGERQNAIESSVRFPRVSSIRGATGHRLRLRFSGGWEGDVDIARIVRPFSGVFAPLRDPVYFERVRVSRSLGTLVWPNGADIAPDRLFRALENPVRVRARRRSPLPTPAPGTESDVPEICRFLGIVIQMYFEEQHAPHFHARYGGKAASIEIRTLQVREGRLPPRVLGLVVEWATPHRRELLRNWERMRRHQKPLRIAPLD